MTIRPTPTASVRRWTDHDTALWHTCDVLAKLRLGQAQALPVLAVPFAMKLGGHEEWILASGNYKWARWAALSDGSYLHNDSVFFATGGVGMALTAAFIGTRSIGNARRKRRAREDATPRWVWGNPGQIHVGTHGFYLQSTTGLVSWDWGSIDMLQIDAPATIRMQGRGDSGPVNWMLTSIWAELVFVLWASTRNPNHPQLIDGSWLPTDWNGWASRQGRPTALSS